MGVQNLWPILSELCERKPLTYLSGKKVAVDLSGWVVQAITCKGLNTSKNPHLRNLFFRISRLLQLGAYPIFVTEGKPPELKEAAIKGRYSDYAKDYSGISRSYFDKTLARCEDFISTLGVPCIKSSGEAEALCAFLYLKGIVDGVITQDNDAFLYGAEVIYRDFSIDPIDSHVDEYCLKSEKNRKNLDRKKLVAFALLLGCDYSKGVPGVGKETAIKLLFELDCDDILQRFKDWKKLSESELFPGLEKESLKKGNHCTRCEHLGSSSIHKKDGCSSCNSKITCYLSDASNPCRCPWHVKKELKQKWKTELKIYNAVKDIPDFPDMKVIDEYLNFTDDIPSTEVLEWACPNLMKFHEKAFIYLSWTFQRSREKCIPIITSWQQYKLETGDCDRTHFIYEPVEILKERSIRDVSYFDVKWKIINKICDPDKSDEDLITTEYGDRFTTCYKKLVDDFYHNLDEGRKAKRKYRKFKSDEGSRKIDEFFVKKRHSQNEEYCEIIKCVEPLNSVRKVGHHNVNVID